jgi:hypothetical protein
MGTQQTDTRDTMGQSATGTPNHIYDLVSMVYHSMESDWTCQQYIQDAQQARDDDLLQFFQQCQQRDRQRAQQAQQLLQQRFLGRASH